MSNDESTPTRLSRRDLLRIAGVSGLTVATGSVATPRSRSVLAMRAQDEAPEGFLAWAYAQRAQAMTAKDLKLLEAIYDPANNDLVAFERDRAAFMNDLGSLWDGQVLNYAATVSLVDLKRSGTEVTARIYETVRMQWIPTPGTVSLESLSQGSRGDITSVFGNRHEVKLVKGERGWRLAQDAYEEPHLYGASPDLVPGSWAAVWLGTPPNNPDTEVLESAEAKGPLFSTMATYTYDRTAAKNYALNHCGSYNPNYCNFNGCGGDCANFVSQCFFAGGQRKDGTWKTYNGVCGGGTCATYSSPNAGTDTWANNLKLRNWVISSGRGTSKSSVSDLSIGDIINYDTSNDGRVNYNHVTIIVATGANALVCSHNPDGCSINWKLNMTNYANLFTHLNSTYSA